MSGGDLLSDPKSKSAALLFGGEVWIENGSQFLLRDSMSIIGDFKQDGLFDEASADFDLATAFDGLHGVDDQIHQRLGKAYRVGEEGGQAWVDLCGHFDLTRGGFGPKQVTNMVDDFGDFHWLDIKFGRAREAQEMIDNAFEAMQFAANNFKARSQLAAHGGDQATQVLLQQLDVNVERAEWVADFMGKASEEAFQEIAFFRDRHLAGFLPERFCQYAFHRWKIGKNANGGKAEMVGQIITNL